MPYFIPFSCVSDLFEEAGGESIDLEMEFELTMMPSLMDCSRQKLRMFHMNLLKYGANVNERVNSKDLLAAFQVVSSSTQQRLILSIYDFMTLQSQSSGCLSNCTTESEM